jgi:hypothetical protein
MSSLCGRPCLLGCEDMDAFCDIKDPVTKQLAQSDRIRIPSACESGNGRRSLHSRTAITLNK